ncbi:MAG: beta-lactamase family protein [Deltaproteobacteria bacterium]|nr:beta-lactamase family protein [Deltaproteobacteria bacterium]
MCSMNDVDKSAGFKVLLILSKIIWKISIVLFTFSGVFSCSDHDKDVNNINEDSGISDVLQDPDSASDGDGEIDGGNEEKCQALEIRLIEVMEDYAGRGMVAGVSSPECGRWTHGMGYGESGDEISTTDLFRIASVTKTFTTATVLKLMEEGSLALEDTIDMYVSGAPNGDIITVKNLLNHTSGLFDIIDDTEFMHSASQDPEIPFTPEELLAVSFSHDPVFDPGMAVEYCNSNFHVLGSIIEDVTGEPASEAITSRVIDPLSLSVTVLEGEPPMTDVIVPGFSETGVNLTGVLHPTVRWTAGAMVTSVDELLSWTESLYGGNLLNNQTKESMILTTVHAPSVSVGLGVFIRNIEGVGEVWAHGGITAGYRSYIMYIPEFETSVVMIANDAGTDNIGVADALALAVSENLH